VVVDTGSRLSIGSGAATFVAGGVAGDPSDYYAAVPISFGRVLVFQFTPNDNNATIKDFGFEADAAAGNPTCGIRLLSTGSIAIIEASTGTPNVGLYSAATSYYLAMVHRGTLGLYIFIKGGLFVNWTLLYVGVQDDSLGIRPYMYSRGVGTMSLIRVPAALYSVPIDTYDTFGRANGAIGNTESVGPDGQAVSAKAWTGATWTIATNNAVNTPTAGSDIVINGGFGADTNWNKGTGTTIADGVAHLNYAGGYAALLLSTVYPATVGVWYSLTFDMPARTSGSVDINVGSTSKIITAATATGRGATRCIGDGRIQVASSAAILDLDNIVAKPLTLSTLFASIQSSTANILASVNITFDATSGVQAGLVLNLDSAGTPANFLLAYYSRADGKVYLDKCVAGVYTNLIAAIATYAAGAKLVVIKDGTSVSVFYNNLAVGTVQTVADAGIISNVLHGLFSTGAPTEAQLDNFAVYARGNEGQHSALDRYVQGG
jgi:hypothetical protein